METKFFERPEGKLAYTDYGGDGDLVIMMPGMGATRAEYRFLAPAVRDAGFHAVTVDLRGQGESSAFWPDYELPSSGQDLLALIDYFDEGPAHVIGTSFSPGAAVWAAAERPEQIRSLVLIGAFVRDPQTTLVQKLMMAALVAGPWKYAGWRMYYKMLYPTRQPPDFDAYLDQLTALLREPGKSDAFQQLAATPRIDSEQRLPKVKVPALVVMGSKDPDWPDPVAEARWIAEQLGTDPVLIDGAGHYPQTEMPEITNPQIIEFLKQPT